MGNISYSYCDICDKEVEPEKKPLDGMQKTIWIIIILSTFGFAIIAYLLYRKSMKKIYCPTCESKLKFSDEPFEKPKEIEDMTPKEKILSKSGKKITVKEPPKKKPVKETKVKEEEVEEEEEKIYCPFCGENLDEKFATCPYCNVAIQY